MTILILWRMDWRDIARLLRRLSCVYSTAPRRGAKGETAPQPLQNRDVSLGNLRNRLRPRRLHRLWRFCGIWRVRSTRTRARILGLPGLLSRGMSQGPARSQDERERHPTSQTRPSIPACSASRARCARLDRLCTASMTGSSSYSSPLKYKDCVCGLKFRM